MAAYAALNSLMYVLEQFQHHPRPPITIEKQQMKSLREIISFLQDFLEKYSHSDMGGSKVALETQIADAAYAAEAIIESSIVDQILAGSSHTVGEKSPSNLFCQGLQKATEDMDLIKKQAIKIQDKIRGINDDQLPGNIISTSLIIGSSIVPPRLTRKTSTMVGFDDVLIEIMGRLTGDPSNRQILPIVGMGGIGKTTLAKNVYDHPIINRHFDICIWVTISQEYILRDILLEALSCVGETYQDNENKSEDELGLQLYKSLCGRRHLIALDDMWSIEAWEKLMLFFPDNNNGSRIMITTRLSNLSNHFGSDCIKMNFLDKDISWMLLCKIVFPEDQCCPLDLEEIGKKIARNCNGLPLSIVVIGGHLANSEKKLEHWEYVAKNLNSMVNLDDDQHCLKILSLSYNHLPVHLKPCFLYMGTYAEDSIIPVSWLINSWVDEGFLKSVKGKSLEMAGREYFNELIDRNLILVHEWGSSGKVKYCKIHDLLRDLCLREGQKDKFLWLRRVHDFDNQQGIQTHRLVSISSKEDNDDIVQSLASLVHLLIRNFKRTLSSNRSRFVKVFEMIDQDKYHHPVETYEYSQREAIFKLLNSRVLAFSVGQDSKSIFPSLVHLQWNLQTLIIRGPVGRGTIAVSPEFWKMSHLRHVELDYARDLPDPPNAPIYEGDDEFILGNLHTILGILNFRLSEEVIKRIPSIKRLRVSYQDFPEERRHNCCFNKLGRLNNDSSVGCWHNYCLNNLGRLNQLESLQLKFTLYKKSSCWIEMIRSLSFPHSLKKLSLHGTRLHCEDMRMIGSLPNLQVLKLKYWSFEGSEWNPVEGEFLCLKFLQIEWCNDLVHWNANSTHYPCLEHLVLVFLRGLKEIPLDIGEIPTLRSIELTFCCHSAVKSAKNLLDQQVELGNEDLRVQVICQKSAQLESLATHNFQVQTSW